MDSEIDKALFHTGKTSDPGAPKLKSDTLVTALKKDKEIELTVKGRKSGKPIPRPVWFALKGNGTVATSRHRHRLSMVQEHPSRSPSQDQLE
jgi:hypothetical protein